MKKTVFLTGATGNMGWAGFKELYARRERFDIRILARDSKKNRKLLAPYADDPSVCIVWGDLMNYDDVLKGDAQPHRRYHHGLRHALRRHHDGQGCNRSALPERCLHQLP